MRASLPAVGGCVGRRGYRPEIHATKIRVTGAVVVAPQTSPTITRAIFSPTHRRWFDGVGIVFPCGTHRAKVYDGKRMLDGHSNDGVVECREDRGRQALERLVVETPVVNRTHGQGKGRVQAGCDRESVASLEIRRNVGRMLRRLSSSWMPESPEARCASRRAAADAEYEVCRLLRERTELARNIVSNSSSRRPAAWLSSQAATVHGPVTPLGPTFRIRGVVEDRITD